MSIYFFIEAKVYNQESGISNTCVYSVYMYARQAVMSQQYI